MRRYIQIVIIVSQLIFVTSLCYSASRQPVRGRQGMVVTSHGLASRVGIDILKKGGNAVDAAVAVGFALAVVYPTAGNIGGGGFMVIGFPDGRNTTIDFREKAPLAASRDMYLDENGRVIDRLSLDGYLASGVPGSVAGLCLALEKYGSMQRKTVMEPAIRLAERGFPVSYRFHNDLVRLKENAADFPETQRTFLKNGEPYEEGEIFRQPDLSRTLKEISKHGSGAFYKGRIAYLIAKDMANNGGLITREDLARYRAVERPPVIGTYRGYEIISMGPPSSGGITLIQALNMLENYDLDSLGFGSSAYIHILTEVMRRVYHNRALYLGDADFVEVPIEGLIKKSFAAAMLQSIDSCRATPSDSLRPISPHFYEGDHTTHYSIVDKDGMTVAVTTTINTGYGSKVVIKGAGFLMNNEMDDFSARPGAPNVSGLIHGEANAIQPEKRMLSSMTPTIIRKDGRIIMTVGCMGGSRIISSVLQIILNVIDHGMTIQEAVDAPRIHHQWQPDMLSVERFALAPDVAKILQQMGHNIRTLSRYRSEAHAIVFDRRKGVYLGAADTRYTGAAIGY